MSTSLATKILRRMRGAAAPAVLALLVLSACSSGGNGGGSTATGAGADAGATAAAGEAGDLLAGNAQDHADASDDDWNKADEVAIALKGSTATAAKNTVKVDGSTVTIISTGTYRISGTLDDGQVVVRSPGDGIVRLVLDGATITNSRSAAIAVMEADEVVVVLADASKNVLSDGPNYVFPDAATDEPNATLFSAADLTIAGQGALNVTGKFNDGIASKDGLVVTSGTIAVDAADDGIRGKDYIVVDGGDLTVKAGGDGLTADNIEDPKLGYIAVNNGTLNVTSTGDGIVAATDLVVVRAKVDIKAGGGNRATVPANSSAKGLKGLVTLVVDGGTVTIDSADDALHSNDRVTVNGGDLTIATGDDGAHADKALEIKGGTIKITASYEGLESAALTIAGGEIELVSRDDGVNGAGGVDGSGVAAPGAARPDTFARSSATLTMSGGRLVVDAGGDGIDINGSVTMTGGTAIVNGPTARGNSAVDYDGTFNISGGLLVGAGSSGMAMAPSGTSSQASLLSNFATQNAGTVVHIKSTDGKSLLTFAPTKAYQSITISSADISRDATYQVYVGGIATGGNTFGLYEAGAYDGGTLLATTTAAAAATRTAGPGVRPAA